MAKSLGKLGIAGLIAWQIIAAGAPAPAHAQQRAVPESQVTIKQSFAPVVKKAAPTVVNVYVQHRVEQMVSPFGDDPIFGQLFGERFGVPRQRIENSLGSGVLVDQSGLVVTNNHVIQGSGEEEITVALSDGREFPAKVVLKDEHIDLAVLRLDAKGAQFPVVQFADSDSLEVGDLVLADKREFEAKLLLTDERTDLAVLKIDVPDEKLPALKLGDSDNLEVGD
ncbi:MAG TPA: trypsin-like peptidase domain-containing protein, partial [Methyloceanibacter sp.]|nr:trypsin-like peptidase domain-containing protein [Methyloceanibacter sp.]